MKWVKYVILLFIILNCNSVSAQFYRYYDENGNVHFTDDFNKVPENQRESAKDYQEAVSLQESDTIQEDTAGQVEIAGSDEGADKEIYDFKAKAEELDRREIELSREYDVLRKESVRLEKLRETVKTSAEAKEFNKNMRALNEDIKKLDQKRNDLYAEIEEYNTRLSGLKPSRQGGAGLEADDAAEEGLEAEEQTEEASEAEEEVEEAEAEEEAETEEETEIEEETETEEETGTEEETETEEEAEIEEETEAEEETESEEEITSD